MRIPVFTADWPIAFNKFSKYLGRHWPSQPLKLNAAREATARLMGYESVHDLQRSLVNQEQPENYFEVDSLVNSMCLRALNKYSLNPIQSYDLFRKAPWRDLTLWYSTHSYFFERETKEAKEKGIILIKDECSSFVHHKTDTKIVELFDQQAIPPYEYVVNQNGLIYRRSDFELIIDSVDLSEDALTEIDYKGSAFDFVRDSLLPITWTPIQDSLGEIGYRGKWKWQLPYMHELVDHGDKLYAIRHTGYQAYYPGSFTFDELKPALRSIYLNQILKHNGQPSVETIDIDGQILLRDKAFSQYSDYLENPLLSVFPTPKKENPTFNKDPDFRAIERKIYSQHNRLREWFGVRPAMSTAIINADIGSFKPVMDLLFSGSYKDLASIQADGGLIPDVPIDDPSYPDELRETNEKIAELRNAGLSVLEHYPELEEYFDLVALGYTFNDFECSGQFISHCHKRSVLFFIYLFISKLQRLTKTYLSGNTSQYWADRFYDPSNIGASIFIALHEGLIDLTTAQKAFVTGSKLFDLFIKQDKAITSIEHYSKFRNQIKSLPYASVGAPYEPTRKSSAEHIAKMFSYGRKYNISPQELSQNTKNT